ncbi:MAG: C25 family cysteine peptidase, partial [Candidatus Delongbacteria bacterium]|nr:C25 family cysteine peptidase [Candidatus Delongbacteria bacterium]
MKNIIFITVILTIFSVYSKVANLSTNSSGLSLTFDISEEYQITDQSIEGDKFKRIVLPNEYGVEGDLSETEYFSMNYYFSAPQNSNIDLKISNIQTSKFIKSELVPAKSPLHGPSGITTMVYKEYVYRADHERSSVEIEYIGKIRNYNLYKLTFYPLVFKDNEASLISKVNVNIKFNNTFNNIPTKEITASDKLEEKILNINYSKVNPFVKNKAISSVFLDKKTEWMKLKIAEEGIYKVTGRMISDKGVDISSALTSKIKVYSSSGEDLSIDPSGSMYHGATEITREIVDIDGDGIFESDDYIEFYALDNHSWKRGNELEHYYNKYSEYSYYWINLGIGDIDDGKEIQGLASISTFDLEVSSFNRSYFFDNRNQELYLDYKSDWFTKEIYPLETVSYDFPMKSIDVSEPVTLRVLNSSLYYAVNGSVVISPYVLFKYKVNYNNEHEISLTNSLFTTTFPADIFVENQNNILTISNLNVSTRKCLNSYEIHYKGNVTADEENEYFVSEMDTNKTYRMNLLQASGRKLFDITDPFNVRVALLDNDNCTIDPTDSLNHFLLWNDQYLTPQSIEVLDYTTKETLHSITDQYDMVIISPDEFFNYYVNDDGGLIEAHLNAKDPVNSVKVVNINDISNEFGRGYQEPAATRNFIKYAFENWGSNYVIIGSDGNYNYKEFLSLNEKKFIYPSDLEGKNYSGSDDFYANLYSTAGAIQNVAIGRFAASNLSDLENVMEKTVSHINNDNLSNMNTRVLLVGDDERNPDNSTWGETMHISNIESIIAPQIPENIFTDKLFTTEFPFEYSTSTGSYLKPRA